MLFKWPRRKGSLFLSMNTVHSAVPTAGGSFADLGLSPKLLERLAARGLVTPSPIQRAAIPSALEGNDILGIAQTGTGKTLAFSLPMLQRLARGGGQGLVIVPTRELAIQVEETLLNIGRGAGLTTVTLIGGASQAMQVKKLRQTPHVLVATPGRLIDLMQQRLVDLRNIKIAVLDEADRMFDIGFAPAIMQILKALPSQRQTMLFSATMPAAIVKMVGQYLKAPVRVEVAPAGTTAKSIAHHQLSAAGGQKMNTLGNVLKAEKGTIIVFTRTKHGAKKIAAAVRQLGHSAVELHANRSLAQRKAAMVGFKSGQYRVLVATDIAARGIDVNGISLVVNYDLPTTVEDYVHRTGRTGRAGKTGRALSFVAPEDRFTVRRIEEQLRVRLQPFTELQSARQIA